MLWGGGTHNYAHREYIVFDTNLKNQNLFILILNNILMKLCFFFFNFHKKKVYSFCCIYLFSFHSLFLEKQTHTRKRESERLLLT